jgi:hypothetical protein
MNALLFWTGVVLLGASVLIIACVIIAGDPEKNWDR